MKRFLFTCAAGLLFYACNDQATSNTAAEKNSTAEAITYAYTPTYSSQFEISDAHNSQTILNLWKDWDNNNLDNAASSFADSVTLYFADGTMMHNSRDSVIAAAKSFRSGFGNVTSTVNAFVPLRSTDKNENWVCIWGKEVRTDNTGKMDSTYLQETWKLDSTGKVVLMYQFAAKPAQ